MLVIKIDAVDQLRNEFIKYDRDYYSYEGYESILDYFEGFEEDIDLDVIAICCDFNEVSFEEFINDYSLEITEDETEEEIIIDYLNDNGGFYQILDDTVIYTAF